ncbi:hypothetical protein FA13DRAFT_1801489 [Coprinellus micaceus]|uniref:Uncharacterized protein n=1 Tax=Coprinellus micaceus TaxID=71717 RepID=A0A4Y7SE52_COPMI|nr:hypothetical protein FA13DRAFT_1801489 [Coprinellus micaceus]
MELTEEEFGYYYAAMTIYSVHEYILLPFYTFFVATIYPQKWRLGKILFVVLRYFPFMIIAIDLSMNYRTHAMLSVLGCRALFLMEMIALRIVDYAGDLTLLLCLWALLGAGKRRYLAIFALIFTAMPIALSVVFSSFKMTEPVPRGPLEELIGFPCAWAATAKGTQHYAILQYVNSAKTAILAIAATISLFVRHRRHTGSLLKILRRDGGIHYATLTVVRILLAIANTPKVTWAIQRPEPAAVIYGLGRLVVPVLGQRLLLNIRRVDYMGSRPVASTLLFAPSPGDEDSFEDSDRTITTY